MDHDPSNVPAASQIPGAEGDKVFAVFICVLLGMPGLLGILMCCLIYFKPTKPLQTTPQQAEAGDASDNCGAMDFNPPAYPQAELEAGKSLDLPPPAVTEDKESDSNSERPYPQLSTQLPMNADGSDR
ncbi:hypothetical protein M413DRAFT_24958 [Hebeloma cylindrosporum]|uniref:Uncharacterized protein n=1 Tax=Hebeloma cylindrosporum TaxID=76867 RepID=A0A0C3C6F1_HEBCY|nr:hypothetical protein M413DRAFT_24958 [Hebeloma cylindrosporum h7]